MCQKVRAAHIYGALIIILVCALQVHLPLRLANSCRGVAVVRHQEPLAACDEEAQKRGQVPSVVHAGKVARQLLTGSLLARMARPAMREAPLARDGPVDRVMPHHQPAGLVPGSCRSSKIGNNWQFWITLLQ